MSAPLVHAPVDPHADRDGWLAERRKGLGGSDAAAILGLDPWKTPLAVYLDKTGQAPDQPDRDAVEAGTRLEPVVADWAADRINDGREHPVKLRRRNAILAHPDHPWMLASVDREVHGHEDGPGILEVKTTGLHAAKQWLDATLAGEQPTLPDRYHVQLQQYLAVTGRAHGWLAVLVGGQQLIVEHVTRDEQLIAALTEVLDRFWHDHVEAGVPPPAVAADDDLLKRLFDRPERSSTLLNGDARDLIADWQAAKAAEKAAEERRKTVEARIKQMLGDAEEGWLADGTKPAVTWTQVTSRRLDSKALRAAHPDIADEFTTETTHRRFQVKEGS